MDIALNPNSELIYSETADYGIYFCTECGNITYLRKPNNALPYFYHQRFNPSCSLSIGENGWNIKINESKRAVNELLNTNEENWFSAIECLIRNQHLYLIENCIPAAKPIIRYVFAKINSIEKDILVQLIGILMSINSDLCPSVVFDIFEAKKYSELEYVKMIKSYIRTNNLVISDDLFKKIINDKISLNKMCELYSVMNLSQKNELKKNHLYKLVIEIINLVDANNSYQVISLTYNVLKTQDRKKYNDDEWKQYLLTLKRKVIESNNSSIKKMINRIDNDLLKMKYIIK